MTPKELLNKYDGDAMKAAEFFVVNAVIANAVRTGITFTGALVERVIAHLGKDGEEKFGRALWGLMQVGEIFSPADITRIALAPDNVRLAACLVALAEEEK